MARSFSLTYSEQEIQQWREARRKNHPSREKIEKVSNKLLLLLELLKIIV